MTYFYFSPVKVYSFLPSLPFDLKLLPSKSPDNTVDVLKETRCRSTFVFVFLFLFTFNMAKNLQNVY